MAYNFGDNRVGFQAGEIHGSVHASFHPPPGELILVPIEPYRANNSLRTTRDTADTIRVDPLPSRPRFC